MNEFESALYTQIVYDNVTQDLSTYVVIIITYEKRDAGLRKIP